MDGLGPGQDVADDALAGIDVAKRQELVVRRLRNERVELRARAAQQHVAVRDQRLADVDAEGTHRLVILWPLRQRNHRRRECSLPPPLPRSGEPRPRQAPRPRRRGRGRSGRARRSAGRSGCVVGSCGGRRSSPPRRTPSSPAGSTGRIVPAEPRRAASRAAAPPRRGGRAADLLLGDARPAVGELHAPVVASAPTRCPTRPRSRTRPTAPGSAGSSHSDESTTNRSATPTSCWKCGASNGGSPRQRRNTGRSEIASGSTIDAGPCRPVAPQPEPDDLARDRAVAL